MNIPSARSWTRGSHLVADRVISVDATFRSSNAWVALPQELGHGQAPTSSWPRPPWSTVSPSYTGNGKHFEPTGVTAFNPFGSDQPLDHCIVERNRGPSMRPFLGTHGAYFWAARHQADGGGFWVEVPALPGCYSQGETVEEALGNVKEVYGITFGRAQLPKGGTRPAMPPLSMGEYVYAV